MIVRTSSNDTDLMKKKASFIQHSLPGLPPGRFQIQVTQKLESQQAGNPLPGALPSLTRKFGVAGPRFALPQSAIHSVFPPANSAGEFSNSFAHVVLETETLPWQRSPYGPDDIPDVDMRTYSTVVDGQSANVEYDEDQATWMAVLLVSPTDLNGQDPSRQIVQGTVLDLIPASLKANDANGNPQAGTLPANAYSSFSYRLEAEYAPHLSDPADPGVGQAITDAVQYINLPCALFNAIAPSVTDLRLMAHVRAVQMDSKPIAAGQTVDQEERYALVLGNRLPESQPEPGGQASPPDPPLGTNVALLVSLEAMEFALRGHAAGSYYDTQVASQANGVVRLAVLYQWRFTSWTDTSFEFESLLKGLNGRDPASANATVPVPEPFLRAAPPDVTGGNDSQAIVQDMLASGYFPLNHVTRVPAATSATAATAIQTVSWYRSPLIPYGAFVPSMDFLSGEPPSTPVFYSADQLLRFDPNVGMFDVSYAAAWELGRLLALYNKDFSVALYRWKQQVAVSYRVLLEGGVLSGWYDDLLALYQGIAADEGVPTGQALHASLLRHIAVRNLPPPSSPNA